MRRLAVLLAMVAAATATADVVHLTDGTRIEGTLKRDSGGWTITTPAGKTVFVPDDRVWSIEKIGGSEPGDAEARLASLRRAVENISDPAAGVERFARFIEQNKGTPAAREAQKDLETWKDRAARRMVKVGGQWVTREQHQEMIRGTLAQIERARELIKQGRLRDADAIVSRVLAIDPTNAAGLYLRGVLAFKEGQLGAAKKCFESVRQQMPDHAPTLNNLGVILWQQKQPLGAVAFYDLAMAAAPRNRQILDNVAEALSALRESDREMQTAKRAARRFIEQDAELQKELAQQGLHRWGATWVTAEKLAEIKAAQEKIKLKIEQLRQEYEKIRDRIAEIESRIDANERTMRRIVIDRTVVDRTTGGVIQLPLPGLYYDLRRENRNLLDDRAELLAKLDTFAERVRAVEQESPVPAYTGLHRLIEVEGTPLPAMPGDAPAQPGVPAEALPPPKIRPPATQPD